MLTVIAMRCPAIRNGSSMLRAEAHRELLRLIE